MAISWSRLVGMLLCGAAVALHPGAGAGADAGTPAPPPSRPGLSSTQARTLYAAGHRHLAAREWRAAEAAFDRLAGERVLLPHAAFYGGLARLRGGQTAGAARDFAVLFDGPGALRPQTRFAARVMLALAEARLRSGDAPGAAQAARTYVERYALDPPWRIWDRRTARADAARAWWLLGLALHPSDPRAAARALMVAGWGFAEAPDAQNARRRAAAVMGRPPASGDLPAPALLARAEAHWSAGSETATAAAARRALDGDLPPSGRVRAWYLLGHATLDADPSHAMEAFRRAALLTGDSRAAFWEGRAALRSGRREAAAALAARLERRDPERAARLWLDLAAGAERSGAAALADRHLARAAAVAPERREGDEARWLRGRLALRRGDPARARVLWVRAAAAYPASERAAAALVWAASLTPDPAAARPLLRQAAMSARTLHGDVARRRLGAAPPPAPPLPPADLPADRLVSPAQELAAMGFYRDAAEAADADGDAGTLSRALAQMGIFPEAIRAAEEGLFLGRDTVREAYPRGFAVEVAAASARVGVDPALSFAVIREESRFDPRAVSSAGAVGLMQLLPSTAAGLARRRLSAAALTDPSLNVRLGTAYLADQLSRFGGDEMLALIAYNAGPGVARRLARTLPTHDRVAAVEQIPIRETREYVLRVLGSRAAYAWLAP